MKYWTSMFVLALVFTSGTGVQAQTFEQSDEAHKRGDYITALNGYRKLAEQGDLYAQSLVGLMYVNGQGVTKNALQAIRWFRRAAEQGLAISQASLGGMYGAGEGVPQDFKKAYFWMLLASAKGDEGVGKSRDLLAQLLSSEQRAAVQADVRNWRPKSADQAKTLASTDYADEPNTGKLSLVQAQKLEQSKAAFNRRDYGVALTGFGALANQGNAFAQNNLGDMYFRGQGVAKDEQQAAIWYRKAAEQGFASAQFNLGLMYDNGQGVAKDEQQAVIWYRKAAEQGFASAQLNLGGMYLKGQGVVKDEQQAVIWYRKAADQGYDSAQYNLGLMYHNGEGVVKDEQQAVIWYRKAADQGYAIAQLNLGVMYASGQGVAKDEHQAYFWWLLASAQGTDSATRNRDRIERVLTTEQRGAAQAAARNWRPKTAAQVSAISGASGLNAAPGKQAAALAAQPDSTGSGFRVARGAIVTNYHVIDGCSRLRVNGVAAQMRGSDGRSDLALLNVSLPGPSTSLRAQRAAVGEPVAVAGYPMRGLLSGFNMTTGNLSSLSGMGGDTRLVQITAPVQPGNSGGPVLDSAGNLMGVVVSKLDAIKAAKLTGDIPQNVNFAINANVLRSFLDANSVEYDTASSDKPLLSTAIADKAKGFTVLVECWK